MEPPVIAALIAATIAGTGWIVNYILSGRSDRINKELEISISYIETQLEELYGPLAMMILEGRRTFQDLLDALGRNYVFYGNDRLPPEEFETWILWSENVFMPRNRIIRDLIIQKTHLIDGRYIPDSWIQFLEHHNSWIIAHERWKATSVEYSGHSKSIGQ